MDAFAPTAEQETAQAAFRTGASIAIEAGAGTGKTSTLLQLAEIMTPGQRGQYVSFNKAIAQEAGAKFPGHVTASTAHSLAFRAVGHRYKRRLDAPRMRPEQVARVLGIDPFTVQYGDDRKVLAAGYLGGVVMRAVQKFCQSADLEPGEDHFPYIEGIDVPTPDGRRGWAANRQVRMWLLPALRRAWADLERVDGSLKFEHDHYLKLWHLSGPRIPVDVIFFDEAQDANPVLVAIIAAQTHAQLVWVGDSQQQIYEFTGAVNALAEVPADQRTFLTQSFRFGPAVAEVANTILELIPDAELRLQGTPTIASVVGPVAEPDVVLFRTNAGAVGRALREITEGRRPYIVGGADDVVRFAKAAQQLRETGWTGHPDLACFTSWGEVLDYVEQNEQGADLALLVRLVEEFTAETIISQLGGMGPEAGADVVLSTAHKSKGREWPVVQLGGDFRPRDKGGREPSELRLLYVACTRAKLELDHTAIKGIIEEEVLEVPLVAAAESVARHPSMAVGVTPAMVAEAFGPSIVAGAEQLLGAEPPKACPDCGRTDVIRGGLVGVHRCPGAR